MFLDGKLSDLKNSMIPCNYVIGADASQMYLREIKLAMELILHFPFTQPSLAFLKEHRCEQHASSSLPTHDYHMIALFIERLDDLAFGDYA